LAFQTKLTKAVNGMPKQYAYKAYPFLFGPLSFVGHFGLNHIEYRYNYLFTHKSHADTSTEVHRQRSRGKDTKDFGNRCTAKQKICKYSGKISPLSREE